MLTIFGAVVELEREYILQRRWEGIAIAKEQGKYTGRKPLALPENFEMIVRQWRREELAVAEAMRRLHMSSSMFCRNVKKIR